MTAVGSGQSTTAAGSVTWRGADARRSSSPVAPPAGWYYPAAGAPGMRYWDGQGWTDHVAALPPPLPAVVVPPPMPTPPAVGAGAVASAGRRGARRADRPPPLSLTWWVWLLVAGAAVCGVVAWNEAQEADVATSPSTVISPPTITEDDTPPQATFFR